MSSPSHRARACCFLDRPLFLGRVRVGGKHIQRRFFFYVYEGVVWRVGACLSRGPSALPSAPSRLCSSPSRPGKAEGVSPALSASQSSHTLPFGTSLHHYLRASFFDFVTTRGTSRLFFSCARDIRSELQGHSAVVTGLVGIDSLGSEARVIDAFSTSRLCYLFRDSLALFSFRAS